MPDAPAASLLRVALGCKCPRCGKGALYRRVLTVRPVCAVCGLDLAAQDAGDGAAVFVLVIFGAIVTVLALMVERDFSPPLWVHAVLWIPITLGGSILLLRPVKAALIAEQYRMNKLIEQAPHP